jgi:hypothetical protein
MSNILSCQGNANQNDTEIPPHPSQYDIIKKINNNKGRCGCGGKKNSYSLLVGM